VLVCLPRILFLNATRIREHQLTQILRSRRAEDAALVALSGQPREIADVIQMGVREHYCIEARWNDWKFIPVAEPKLFQSLEKPAVEQNLSSVVLEEVLGTRNRAGRPKKGEFRHVLTTISGFFEICRGPACKRRAELRCYSVNYGEAHSYPGDVVERSGGRADSRRASDFFSSADDRRPL